VFVTCEACKGKRFNRETLEITYKSLNIADVLALSVSEALSLFANVRQIAERLAVLESVGLGYLQLGQPATTLSGGEAQRVKLAAELSRKNAKRTCFILDEPTTGLHFQDIEMLLEVMFRLRDAGGTLIVVEHHLDVIKCADYVIDLGPEGGEDGGEIVVAGTPEEVARHPSSHTGRFLRPKLETAAQQFIHNNE
jgi:excinuclease ABC subunit A